MYIQRLCVMGVMRRYGLPVGYWRRVTTMTDTLICGLILIVGAPVALAVMMLIVAIMLVREYTDVRRDVDKLTRRDVIVHPYDKEDDNE